MELEEDLNMKVLDEVKRDYLHTFEYFKNGKPNWNEVNSQKQEQTNHVTLLYKFLSVDSTPLLINERNKSSRKVFNGEYLYGKNKISFNIIGKNLEIEENMIQMFKKPSQCYILHKVQIFELMTTREQSSSTGGKGGVQFNTAADYYYVLDEHSQILEDESMDFISTLTRLSDNQSGDEFVFETNYSSQMSQMQPPLNITHFKLLQPRVISSFQGIITQVSEGKNLLQIEELIDQFHLNSRRDRFYVLKVVSARNYIDTLDVYLIYNNEDQEAKSQLAFYLHPFQRILLFQSLRHFNHKLQLFAISFFYTTPIHSSNSNFEKFNIAPKGIEFFSRYDIEKNKQQLGQMINNYNKLSIGNLSSLLSSEGVMMRSHLRLYVKVKKIKYLKIRLNCAGCQQEWTKGFKHCINCKETKQQISFQFQVLVQDQHFLEQQGYLYLYDEIAIQFFNISEQERREIQKYLIHHDTYMQLYYSIQKDYPLSIIRFKDRIFTKDTSKLIIALPFADISNKILNSNQLAIHEERTRIENQIILHNIVGEDCDSKYMQENNKNTHKKQHLFINGTYIASNFATGQKNHFKPIPCLKVVHVFQSDNIISQGLKIIEEIQNLKIQISEVE